VSACCFLNESEKFASTTKGRKGLINEMNDDINRANRSWYVVRTKAGDEHRANGNLLNQEMETFLPLFKDCCYHNGKMIPRIRPLFPNYLFANFDLELHYYKVKWTRGVGLILGNSGGPIPISEKVVQAIRDRIGRDNLVELEDQIKKGDLVQITSGPLKDLTGIFEKRMSGKDRVTILLNLIGVDVPVQISKYQIRKVA
jgi:transcriptional antiterminator RfaH